MANWTIDQYNTLCDAIAQGAKAVKYADKEIVYRTFEEMDSIKRQMEVELGLDGNNTNNRTGRRIADFCDPNS